MGIGSQNVAHRRIRQIVKLIIFAMASFVAIPATSVAAQTNDALQTTPLVTTNDRGGLLRDRLRQLVVLRQQDRTVQIRGRICLSTCTLLISLPNTCVSPSTTFGFHGPSSYGRPLDPETFNRASEIIADHYPPALRNWYMETGRFRINTMYRISGKTLINLGVRAC